ncbi:hypothetical protein AWJ20_3447 [Sugiyamaella lignohabitans]|uniref:Uncharacterized protein n=1 Tax=Sugiyamaella lignohabitans TaxID=796027 RepID=A0A167FWU6_9ASCO|nr:uncharacterized protein AWJ20_3447 [Sugiyamaella lignohabitans]ANB15803.1 hypothetical protein AWJ20_3447 [Sugiyamaella lignohabitans]
MGHKVILPDTCEPLEWDSISGGSCPQLVFAVFGLFRYDKAGDKGVHSTRGEWLIVDEILSRGANVYVIQLAPRHNVRVIKSNTGDPKDSGSGPSNRGAAAEGGSSTISGVASNGAEGVSGIEVPGSVDDDHELHKEPNPEPRAIRYPKQWKKTRNPLNTPQAVADAIRECINHFGKVDVVVNWIDVGFDYGLFSDQMAGGKVPAPPTELNQQEEETELRKLMEQNTFTLFNIIKGTLPSLRKFASMANSRKSNHTENNGTSNRTNGKPKPSEPITVIPKIFSVSSSLGFIGGPGVNAYSTSRWAAEGMMETLNYEVHEQGIRTTTIDLGLHPLQTAQVNSLGNLVWDLAHCNNPPIRIALGRQATKTVKDKLRSVVEEVEDWKYLFEPAPRPKNKAIKA